MIKITFNAFSILRPKLKEKNINCGNALMEIEKEISVRQLIDNIGLNQDEVYAVFINHKILPKDTILKQNDRVALVPPGGIPNHIKAYVGDCQG